MVENAGKQRTDYNPTVDDPPNQHADTGRNPTAAAALRQQQALVQAASLQRETTESLALLCEAVLRLTQHAIREAPTAAPTSRLTKLSPDDDVEA